MEQLSRQLGPQAERFAEELDRSLDGDSRLGLAVSGGPDSLALLLLAAASKRQVQVATVDHGFRPESRHEAAFVAGVCSRLGIDHQTLTLKWDESPKTAIQERARTARYHALEDWAGQQGIGVIATGHHLDDQAETFLMRLRRGAGVRGLASMRARSVLEGGTVLIRPLLGWRRSELERICDIAGIDAVQDGSNTDTRFERVRIRQATAETNWLDPEAIAASAGHLAEAEEALRWAAERLWKEQTQSSPNEITLDRDDVPIEILRRLVSRAVLTLATEGNTHELRGRELDELLSALSSGAAATLRGVHCLGGATWRFRAAPPRRSV